MYQTKDNSQIYYVQDFSNNKVTKIGSKQELIIWCVHNLEKSFYQVNMNGNDLYRSDIWDYYRNEPIPLYYLRKYLFFDGLFRIIDVRQFSKEILNYVYPKQKRTLYKWKYIELPQFRNGPIPYTGYSKHYCGLRHMKTTNERRQNCAPELKEFVRAKRNKGNLPNAWDDIFRPYSKCWKDCTKKRKQWMK